MSTINKNDTPVCYVRVKKQYHGYLKAKYGGFPLNFPELHPASMLFETRIVRNPSLAQVSKDSYSEMAYNYQRDGKALDAEIGMPSEDERELFVPVSLPPFIQRKSGIEKVTGNWQLSRDGGKAFRKIISREFWMECIQFIDESFIRASKNGIHMTKEIAITDFMLLYDVPIEYYDDFIKQEYRKRKAIGEDIESSYEKKKNASENKIFCS